MVDNSDRSFGYDALKLRAVFIPEGNPDNVTAADITEHLGHDVLRIRAIFIPDGNPDNVTAADITDFLGHDVARVRYAWRSLEEGGLDLGSPPDGPGSGGQADGRMQGTGYTGFAPIRPLTAPVLPPTPTPAQVPRYVDPAKTAVAAWRAINVLSPSGPLPPPPVQPAVSHGADGKGETVAQPDAGPAGGLEPHRIPA